MKKIILAVVLLTGCAVGPKFRAPEVLLPDTYSYALDSSKVEDLSRWWQRFSDPTLDSLVEHAFVGNRNLLLAIKNIEIARLKIASARAQALPAIGVVASGDASYTHRTKIVQEYSVGPTISWDIDLWGKIRREAEAAGASFRMTEYKTSAILQTLSADVATAYFTAIAYQHALLIAQSTYSSRSRSYHLMESLFYYGSISEVDLQQSRASLATAGATVEQYKRLLEQTIIALNLLMGDNPHTVALGPLRKVTLDIASGLPSSLLERRPDVMQAYYGVQQANAMIGVAIANRLPSISLTGSGGLAATIIRDAASGQPLIWSGAAKIIAPILSWGNLRRAQTVARIQTEQAVLEYEQAVLGAISEVEQSLVAVDTYSREVEQSAQMVSSSQKAAELVTELYKTGSSSYLDVLDADRTLFAAQLQYVQTINSQIASYVTLYKALGGGY